MFHRNLRPLSRRAQAGFTLIEALVSLLVVSFGMLAVAGMQATLSRSSELAKQRSEAVRLAQVKMEQLRSFDSIVSGSGTWNYSTNVVSGTDAAFTPANSNTAFTRSWTVTGTDGVTAAGADDAQKWIHVLVRWADRSSTTLNQSVQLDSVIARNNPTALKSLIAGQTLPAQRQPKNRNLNIPYPAVGLSGGTQSAFIPPPGAKIFVFDNSSGNIVQSCDSPKRTITSLSRTSVSSPTVTVTTTAAHTFVVGNKVEITGVSDTAFNGTYSVVSIPTTTTFTYTLASPLPTALAATGGTATFQLVEGIALGSLPGCTPFGTPAYLLSGYIRFSDATTANGLASGAENSTDATRDLDVTSPLLFTDPSGSLSGKLPSASQCYAQRQVVKSAANVQPATISSISRSGGTVTLTTTGNHGYPVGVLIAVEGLSDFTFEGSFEIISVPSSTTLTYLQPGAVASISGTGTSKIKLIQQITLAETDPVPSGYNGTESRFVSYACIVTPVDDDGIPATPNAWWGQVDLNPSGWVIGATYTNLVPRYKVCRYTGDYIAGTGLSVSNSEHPRYYRKVTGALDSQNFFVIRGDQDCPGDLPAVFTGSVGELSNANTVPHQPSTVVEFSYQCLAVNGSNQCSGTNKRFIESATLNLPTDAIPMN